MKDLPKPDAKDDPARAAEGEKKASALRGLGTQAQIDAEADAVDERGHVEVGVGFAVGLAGMACLAIGGRSPSSSRCLSRDQHLRSLRLGRSGRSSRLCWQTAPGPAAPSLHPEKGMVPTQTRPRTIGVSVVRSRPTVDGLMPDCERAEPCSFGTWRVDSS